MTRNFSGIGVSLVIGGAVLAYSGLNGKTITNNIGNLLNGNAPASVPSGQTPLATSYTGGNAVNSNAVGTGAAQQVVSFAEAQIGKPYIFGAAGPNAYDCSGLVVASYKSAGISLPHYTGLLIGYGESVTEAELSPADLVFPDSGHVQIYVGDGKICEAAESGIPVRVVPIWGFWQARRII